MSKTENPILRLTVQATRNLSENRFIELDGTFPAAGGWAAGVSHTGAKDKDYIAVTAIGVAPVVAGAAIARGDKLKVTADGKVIKHTNNTVQVGRALEAAAAADNVILALINTAGG